MDIIILVVLRFETKISATNNINNSFILVNHGYYHSCCAKI